MQLADYRGVRVIARYIASLMIGVLVMLGSLPAPWSVGAQEVPELQINSKRYIVIDADTGEIFAQRGAHDQVAMASLTKIFTTIEALEEAPLTTQITTTEDDLFGSSSTTMGFGPGETFTLEDLLYGMMLPSGNDAAYAIARTLGAEPGDTADEAVARFVGRANQRIANLGLTDTNLINPHGWGVPNHYSSAYDLAAFTMYALHYPTFVNVIGTLSYTTSDGTYTVTNTNKLLSFYSVLVGGKTGYDDDAGWCLIEVARRDGTTLISVTLDGIAPDDWYDDNYVLLEYGFEQKAKRLSAGTPISGELVSFRDPDAALIEQHAESGASLGVSLTPDAPASSVPATPVAGSEHAADSAHTQAGNTERSGLGALRLVGFSLLAVIVLGASAVGLFRWRPDLLARLLTPQGKRS